MTGGDFKHLWHSARWCSESQVSVYSSLDSAYRFGAKRVNSVDDALSYFASQSRNTPNKVKVATGIDSLTHQLSPQTIPILCVLLYTRYQRFKIEHRSACRTGKAPTSHAQAYRRNSKTAFRPYLLDGLRYRLAVFSTRQLFQNDEFLEKTQHATTNTAGDNKATSFRPQCHFFGHNSYNFRPIGMIHIWASI